MARILLVLTLVVTMGGVAAADGPSVNVSGHYSSNWGDVDLSQSGDQVSGSYACCGGGTISGRIENQVIHFTWRQPDGNGRGVWTISQSQLDGTWGKDTQESGGGRWDLSSGGRQILIPAPPPTPAPQPEPIKPPPVDASVPPPEPAVTKPPEIVAIKPEPLSRTPSPPTKQAPPIKKQLSGKPPPGQVAPTAPQCRLRGIVTAPAQGELLAMTAASKVTLKGRFETLAGAGSTQLEGSTPMFSVEVDGKDQRVPGHEANGEITGELELQPPDSDSSTVSIRLFGDGGSHDVCPGATTSVRITKLGVGLEVRITPDAANQPARCYVGRPCPIQARLILPRDPAARATTTSFATAPDLRIALTQNKAPAGTLAATAGDPESWYAGSITPATAGVIDIAATASSATQKREVSETTRVTVREPLELVLPTALDLGTVIAGDPGTGSCAKLDFTKSRGIVDEKISMKSTEPVACTSVPALQVGGLGRPLPDGLQVEMQLDTRELSICVAKVPRCAEEHPAPVILTVVPENPDFADQKVEIKLTWRVEGRSWFACYRWWIFGGLGALGLLLIGYGFVKPSDFSSQDAIKMAGDRTKLQRAVRRRLRELPGGRSGWYRNAATGVREDGSATRKLSQAAVVLQARNGDVLLRARGGLHRVHPQTKKLEPYAPGKDGTLASKGVVYVVGNLHFMID